MDVPKITWARVQVLGVPPPARFGHTATLIGSQIFIFGGVNLDGAVFDDLWILSLTSRGRCSLTGQWIAGASRGSAPSARYGHSAFAYDGRLYIYGGTNGTATFPDLYMLDSERLYWSQAVVRYSPTSGRSCHASVFLSSAGDEELNLLVYGGLDASFRALDDSAILHLGEFPAWDSKPGSTPLPSPPGGPRCGHSLVSFAPLAQLAHRLPRPCRPLSVRDAAASPAPTSAPTPHAPRASLAKRPPSPTRSHSNTFSIAQPSVLDEPLSSRASDPSSEPRSPAPRCLGFLLGGGAPPFPQDRASSFCVLTETDPPQLSWLHAECAGLSPFPRSLHTACRLRNRVFLYGGRNLVVHSDVHVLDLQTMTWHQITGANVHDWEPGPRLCATSVAFGSSTVIFFGGLKLVAPFWDTGDALSQQFVACSDVWILTNCDTPLERPSSSTTSWIIGDWLASEIASIYDTCDFFDSNSTAWASSRNVPHLKEVANEIARAQAALGVFRPSSPPSNGDGDESRDSSPKRDTPHVAVGSPSRDPLRRQIQFHGGRGTLVDLQTALLREWRAFHPGTGPNSIPTPSTPSTGPNQNQHTHTPPNQNQTAGMATPLSHGSNQNQQRNSSASPPPPRPDAPRGPGRHLASLTVSPVRERHVQF